MEKETRIRLMSQKRSLTGFLVASLGLAAALAVVASPDLASAGDCGKYKKAEVKAVCEKGGSIEDAMKAAVKKAKDGGATVACTDCHEGKDKTLKSNASADFDAKLAKHFK
jgi:hypothetical protein